MLLSPASWSLVQDAFEYVVKREYGNNRVSYNDGPQWVFWLKNNQVDRLTSGDILDGGAIPPTNLTQSRFVDIIDGGNDKRYINRFLAAYRTALSKGMADSLAIQYGAIAACPVLPSFDGAYELLWRKKDFQAALKSFDKTTLITRDGRFL